MGDYSEILGISLFVLSISMVSLAGGAEFFIFNFDYQNATVQGESVNIGLQDSSESFDTDLVYYDANVDKLRVNESAVNDTVGATPSIDFNANVTGIESYTISAELPIGYYNQCGGSLQYQQGLITEPLLTGTNTFQDYSGTGEFGINWNQGLFDGSECRELLYDSNITGITVNFPSASEIGTLDFVQQLTSAESGYQWFNYIIMGSIGILIGYIIIRVARGG